MMRRLLKGGMACGLRWSGADRVWRALRGVAPWVVGYHRVVEDFGRSAPTTMPPMLIGRRMLERQLDWIGRHFRPATLDEIGASLEGPAFPGRPLAAVTFDDGYRDVYHHALPLLRSKGIPAAMFVVTGLVGSDRPPLHDRLFLLLKEALAAWKAPREECVRLLGALGLDPAVVLREASGWTGPHAVTRHLLQALPGADLERIAAALAERVTVDPAVWEAHLPLTWEMVGEMRRAGVIIGSHTRSHRLLPGEDPGTVADEVEGSRRDLEARLGSAPRHFAYPNGSFDMRSVRAVAGAGYRYAYTACGHRDPGHPLLTIPRTLLWERSALDSRDRFSVTLMGWQVPGPLRVAPGCAPAHLSPTRVAP